MGNNDISSDEYYVPYGKEWEKELKKTSKPFLVDFVRNSLLKIAELSKEIDKRDKILDSLLENPYPTDIFPELSKDQLRLIHQVISAHLNIPLDRLTGHIGRLLRKPYQEDIIKLKGN